MLRTLIREQVMRSNFIFWIITLCLLANTNNSLANESLSLYIDTSEGGHVSKRGTDRLVKFLNNNHCMVNQISSANKLSSKPNSSFLFTPIRQKLSKDYTKIANIKIINDEPLSASILVRGSTGINDISSLDGVRMAFLSPESITGYQLPQQLFKEANITHSKDRITFTQTNSAAASLLLHKDVFAAAIATPIAKKWAKSNDLIIVSTSSEVDTGGLWVNSKVPTKIADICTQTFILLNKIENKKLRTLFPVWLDGFHYINH